MSTIFSKIIAGEIPCHRVAENENFIAFLDINPLAKGHVLVIPKKNIDYLFDMEDADLSKMMVFSKKVAKGIEQIIPCKKIGVAVIGLEVAHAHIHLVPINGVYDIDFSKPKLSLSTDEMEQIARDIASKI